MKKENMPDLLLEKYVLEETSPGETEQIRRLAANDETVSRRITALKKSNTDILIQYPMEYMITRINRQLQQEPARSGQVEKKHISFIPRILAYVSVLAVIITGIFIGFPAVFNPAVVPVDDTVRLKGDSRLKIYKQKNGAVEQLADGDTIAAYETIQLSYSAGNQKYGTIFSLDGRGIVTLHFPYSPEDSPLLDTKGEVPLALSYELDDAPAYERFFFITSDRDFSVREILDSGWELSRIPAGAKQKPLELADEFRQLSILLQKEN